MQLLGAGEEVLTLAVRTVDLGEELAERFDRLRLDAARGSDKDASAQAGPILNLDRIGSAVMLAEFYGAAVRIADQIELVEFSRRAADYLGNGLRFIHAGLVRGDALAIRRAAAPRGSD